VGGGILQKSSAHPEHRMMKAIFDIKRAMHPQAILHRMARGGQHTALRYLPNIPVAFYLLHHSPNVLYLIFGRNGSRPTSLMYFTPAQKGQNSVSQYRSDHFATQVIKSP
jgi:hypothetical protein